MPRFDKVTKEYLGVTDDSSSASDRDSSHPMFRGDSQDLSMDSDTVIETENFVRHYFNQTSRARTNPAVEQVNVVTHVEVEAQEMTVPTNQVANQAEGVIADQVAAISFPFTALAKVRKIFRPLNTMHNYLYKK